MHSQVKIRKGIKTDLPAVHRLVRELALYENAPEEVETTVEIYEKDGFGERPLFEFFVAETLSNEIIGAAVFYIGYSTWKGKKMYLDDIVITESWRRKGIGIRLFEVLIAHAKGSGARQLRWHVLDWNTPAIEFYKKINASLDPEWVTGKLSYEQLQDYEFTT